MKRNIIVIIILIIVLILTALIVSNKKEIEPLPVQTVTLSNPTYKYINFFDWPPQIEVLGSEYSCTNTSTTTEIVINNNKYCRSVVSEGAAGSIYNTYTYGFAKENTTVSLTFSTRQPQCLNYDDPKQTECLNEIKNVDVDNVVDEFAVGVK